MKREEEKKEGKTKKGGMRERMNETRGKKEW